jgi:hypothetical protein
MSIKNNLFNYFVCGGHPPLVVSGAIRRIILGSFRVACWSLCTTTKKFSVINDLDDVVEFVRLTYFFVHVQLNLGHYVGRADC